jgi:hypothetical protein
MPSTKADETTAAQLREARDEIDSLKADNAHLRGVLQEAISDAGTSVLQSCPAPAYGINYR